MLRAARFHHVAVIASDIDRSLAFYRALGFDVAAREHRADRDSWKCDLMLPSGDRIELFSFPDPPPRPTRPEAAGLRHLAFEIDDYDDVLRRADEVGIECEPTRIDEATGARFTFLADPDGLPIELYEVARATVAIGDVRRFIADPCPPLAHRAEPPWAALRDVVAIVSEAVARPHPGFRSLGEGVLAHEDTHVHRSAELVGPLLIGPGVRVFSGTLLRATILLDGVTVGHGTEVARSIVHPGSALAHFNFVGDSLIGADVNLEAGAVIASRYNERADKRISVETGGNVVDTGLTKFGAVVGDHARIGANAVVGPGVLLAPHAVVPRLTHVAGP